MSKAELQEIQEKLKGAIQNHQKIVAELKADPKNEEKQRALRQAQNEITLRGEQQKLVIVRLRRQINQQKEPRTEVPTSPPVMLKKPEPKTHHTPRPSILQGGRSVLKLQNEGPVKSPPPGAPTDLKHLLQASANSQSLSPKQLQKAEYMASLNLVTRARLKELESRRGERRRRSTATPQFSYVHGHHAERKRASGELIQTGERKRGRPPLSSYQKQQPVSTTVTEASVQKPADPVCSVCNKTDTVSPSLRVCTTCSRAYQVTCVQPGCDMVTSSNGSWICPSCKPNAVIPENSLAQKFLALRETEKEQERTDVLQQNIVLKENSKQLEERANQLGGVVQKRLEERARLQKAYEAAQQRVLKIQQMLQELKKS